MRYGLDVSWSPWIDMAAHGDSVLCSNEIFGDPAASQVSYGLQLHSLCIVPTAAVS